MEQDPFLAQLAGRIYAQYGKQAGQVTLVFPNRRAGLFFRRYLSRRLNVPVWSPRIFSMEDFVRQHSTLQEADRITLVFLLYQVYKVVIGRDEGFDKFYGWGEMLLGDFDELDRYLTDAKGLFKNLTELKEIDAAFPYLTDEQRAWVHQFWSAFSGEMSAEKAGFLSLWKNLEKVYATFRKTLEERQLAYSGMIYRAVAENPEAYGKVVKGPVIFAGFNALTRAEERLLTWYVEQREATVYWDADAYYMDEKQDVQEAGYFLRKYARHPVLKKGFEVLPPADLLSKPKKVRIIGVPHETGQAKKAGELLEEMAKRGELNVPEKTVVVLADEGLLFPVLHSLPANLPGSEADGKPLVNVTMGYPLRHTSLYGLLEQLVEMQQRAVHLPAAAGQPTSGETEDIPEESAGEKGPKAYHFRYVTAVLRHPLVYHRMQQEARILLEDIEKRNRIHLPAEELAAPEKPAGFRRLFRPLSDASEVMEYLLEVLKDIRTDRLAQLAPTGAADLELEYVHRFETHLKRLQEILQQNKIILALDTFLRLFRNLVQYLRVPFSGEPLTGLQIMGMLETRNLDFDHVFVLSMNEGVFPPGGGAHSYIPYNLRRGFGLPVADHADATSAYLFYRLMQRAKTVTLFYNATVSTKRSGGMSRFLYQLLYEAPFPVHHEILANPVRNKPGSPITILKTPPIQEAMGKYLEKPAGTGEKALTASAINTYLDCRLKFYFRYIAELYEPEEVQEEVDQMVFGNLLHHTMELLYQQYSLRKNSSVIEKADIEQLHKRLPSAINQAFLAHFGGKEGEPFRFEGRNVIVERIIAKMAAKVLENDFKYAPFEIIGLEAKEGYELHIDIKPGTLRLKGVIDRIDKKENVVRVIDYKTGKDDKRIHTINSLFDRDHNRRNKAAFQTFLYGLLFKNKHPEETAQVMPGLYNVRELFMDDFSLHLQLVPEPGSRERIPVTDVAPYEAEYLDGLQALLEELYDPALPFDQTDDEKKCMRCPYRAICHR